MGARISVWRDTMCVVCVFASICLGARPGLSRPALPAAVGSFGPFVRATVYLSKPDNSPSESLGTIGTAKRQLDLPQADEPAKLFDVDPRNAVLLDVDHKPGNELVVLYHARKIGTDSPSYWASLVYKWNGAALIRLRPVERRLEGCRSPAAVVRRLHGGRCR